MARPSKVDLLPDAVRDEFERRLIAQSFSRYDDLAAWLGEQGFEVSRSSLHRHGSQLERKLEAIRASTKAAQLIAETAPDDADMRSAATISLVQTEVFDLLVALQEVQDDDDPAERLKVLSRAAKSIAELSRASVNQKKWMTSVREKAQAAARTAEAIARKGGLSENAVAEIRGAILGIPS